MTLPSLIESGIAEFFRKHGVVVRNSSDTGEPQRRIDTHVDLVNKSLEEFAQTIYNAAIESALEALPDVQEIILPINEAMNEKSRFDWAGQDLFKKGQQSYGLESRAKLSALKKENV